MPAGDSNSIEASSAQSAKECEALFWGALCSPHPDSDAESRSRSSRRRRRRRLGASRAPGKDGDDADEEALEEVEEQMDPDCVIVNPLIHPDRTLEALSAETSPTLHEALARLLLGRHSSHDIQSHRHRHRRSTWRSWHMHSRDPAPAFAQPAMMAVQIMYRVTLVRERHRRRRKHRRARHEGGEEEDDGAVKADEGEEDGEDEAPSMESVDAFCTSTWRQGSNGGWKLCAQQLVPLAA